MLVRKRMGMAVWALGFLLFVVSSGHSALAATVESVNSSASSVGMGGIGAFLPNNDPTLTALNPSKLASIRRGLCWSHMNHGGFGEQDLGKLSDDHLTISFDPGIGLSLDGRPFSGVGGREIAFPNSVLVNLERLRTFGIGIHLVETIRTAVFYVGKKDLPKIDDYVELDLGYAAKHLTLGTDDKDSLKSAQHDLGASLHLRYENLTDEKWAGWIRNGGLLEPIGGFRIDAEAGLLSVGYSGLSSVGMTPSPNGSDSIRQTKWGGGIQVRSGLLRGLRRRDNGSTPTALAFLGPLFAIRSSAERWRVKGQQSVDSRFGAEFALLDVLALRLGRKERDDSGSRSSSGFGLNIHYRNVVRLQVDRAYRPSAKEHERLTTWGIEVDPFSVLSLIAEQKMKAK